MADLDDLASAARTTRSPGPSVASKPVSPVSSTPQTIQSGNRLGLWLLLGVGVLCLCGLVGVGAFYAGRASAQPPPPQTLRELIREGEKQEIDPKFSFDLNSNLTNFAFNRWTLTNEDQSPLIINSVTMNGEYRAIPFDAKFPITLSIGQSAILSQDKTVYQRDIIYTDFDTNRGKFRWKGSVWEKTP